MKLSPVLLVLTLVTHSLCVWSRGTDMASGKSTSPTVTQGMSIRNQLYDKPKPAPCQRQNTDVSPLSNLTSDNTTDPGRSPETVRPLNDGHTSRRTGESRRLEHKTVSPGRCLYYTDPLECWARQESRGLNWLWLAREYNSSFDYDFPDTCWYTSRSFRCTIQLPGHLATILRTLTMYDLRYQIKMADRGPYGLHLDFLLNLEDVVNLMDLFSAESALQFQQQVWDFEESIYEALKKEVYGLPKVKYDRRDLRPSFYVFFARVCNQIDPQDSDRRLQRIHVLEWRQPLTSLDDYLNNVHTRVVSGMPSAIHVHPTTAPHPHGKWSATSSKAPSTKDSGHIYTEANSAVNYLLPTPSQSLPDIPHGPPGGVLSSSRRPLEVPQPQQKLPGYEQTKSIFARWIEKKKNADKNLSKVWTIELTSSNLTDFVNIMFWFRKLITHYKMWSEHTSLG